MIYLNPAKTNKRLIELLMLFTGYIQRTSSPFGISTSSPFDTLHYNL